MSNQQTGTLEFTVDLPHLVKQFAIDYKGHIAALGAIQGLAVAMGHLVEIGKIAIEQENVAILLRLYALGIIENPTQALKESDLWSTEYDELARRVGAI